MLRRVWCILGRALVVVSLLVGLALLAMWVRSYWKADGWTRSKYLKDEHELRAYSVGSERGRAGLILLRLWFDPARVKTKEEGPGRGTVYIPALMAFWV